MAGGGFIIILTLAAIFAPLITPYSFSHQDLSAILQNPSAKHWLGTDGLGGILLRDCFTERAHLSPSVYLLR